MKINFNFKSGNVILNDFDFDISIPYEEQKWSFKEDILQVRYQQKYVLDLGWYPDFDLDEGAFRLVVVEIDDWLNPLFSRKTNSVVEIIEFVNEAIIYLESIV